MKKNLIFISFLLMFTTTMYSQKQESDSPIIELRDPFELNLAIDNQNYFSASIQGEPYIFENTILKVYTGEDIFVELNFEDSILISTNVVSSIRKPELTLRIKIEQRVEDKNNKGTMLTISNPFEKRLVYSVIMNPYQEKKYIETSTLPIDPGLTNYELWPQALTSLVFLTFELE